MRQGNRNARLSVRLRTRELLHIQAAAVESGLTLSNFACTAALEKATQVLGVGPSKTRGVIAALSWKVESLEAQLRQVAQDADRRINEHERAIRRLEAEFLTPAELGPKKEKGS